MKFLAGLLSLLSLSLPLPFSTPNALAAREGKKVVFVDGVFDLAHYGHQNVVTNARKTAAEFFKIDPEEIYVLVGISGTEEELKSYKRKSVYSIGEKMRQVGGFKGVDEVVNSPMVTTASFIEEHGIDLVVAGSDYTDLVKAGKYYQAAIDKGIFANFPRTEGVSTTDLMMRTTVRTVEDILKELQNSPEASAKEEAECAEKFLALLNKRRKS